MIDTKCSIALVRRVMPNGSIREELFHLVAAARTTEAVAGILQELLSPHELDALAERWQIVQLLLDGCSQREVRDRLQVAIATVSRGARVIKYGSGRLEKIYARQRHS